MFLCDDLIYIQLQKTGCTHIAELFNRLFTGKKVGKHNSATYQQLHSDIIFISSIRNPWDWYVSVWAFGVSGRGLLYQNLTRKNRIRKKLQSRLGREQNFGGANVEQQASELVEKWKNVYDSTSNVDSFRKWLRIIHDPKYRSFLGEGYGNSSVHQFCGLMTYRYLRLCCSDNVWLKQPGKFRCYSDLTDFSSNNCYIDYFIRLENLEESFCEVVEKIRPMTEEERKMVCKFEKTNSSSRKLLLRDYYDQESTDIVASSERLVIEKFNYQPTF